MFHRSTYNTYYSTRNQRTTYHKDRSSGGYALPPRYQNIAFDDDRRRSQYYDQSPYYNGEYYEQLSPLVHQAPHDSYYYEDPQDQYYVPQKVKYDHKYDSREIRQVRNNGPRVKYNKNVQNTQPKKKGQGWVTNQLQQIGTEQIGLKVDTGNTFNCDAPFYKKSELQNFQNYDERTQLSDEDASNQNNKYGQTEILSSRLRFMSVDNLDDSKTDFGIKDNQSYEKSEQPGKAKNDLININKIDDCQLSVSEISEKDNKVPNEGQSNFEVSSTSSEISSQQQLDGSKNGQQFSIAEINENTRFDQNSQNLNLNEEEEEEDIIIQESFDVLRGKSTRSNSFTKNGNSSLNSDVSSCLTSVEAQPFYPTKNSTTSNWEPNVTENSEAQQSLYNQMGSVKDQIQYQNKFLAQQKFQRVHKVDQSAANNPFAFKDNGRIMSKDYKIKIKTELCRTFTTDGTCPYGDTCAFAHGESELQKKKHVPSRYKTKLCQQFHESSYCPYGNRCQFIHSTKLNEIQQKKTQNDENQTKEVSVDLKNFLSHKQMLTDNIECLKQRLTSSQNPYLNEFNLIYKDVIKRLPVFEAITSDTLAKLDVQIHEASQQKQLQAYLEQEYAILEAKLQANLRAQAEYKAKQRMAQRAQMQQEYQHQQYMETNDLMQQQKYIHSNTIVVFSPSNY